jgi:hypothetical protein
MAVTSDSVIVGVFDTVDQAERAFAALQSAGFPENELGFLIKGEGTAGGGALAAGDTHMNTGAAAGAAAGGLGGALAGAALAGVIPGIGPLISAGILGATLIGAFTGAVSTGLFGAIVGLGFSDDQAKTIEAALKAGHPIITVRTDRQDEATRILTDAGARFAGPGDTLPSTEDLHEVGRQDQ